MSFQTTIAAFVLTFTFVGLSCIGIVFLVRAYHYIYSFIDPRVIYMNQIDGWYVTQRNDFIIVYDKYTEQEYKFHLDDLDMDKGDQIVTDGEYCYNFTLRSKKDPTHSISIFIPSSEVAGLIMKISELQANTFC